MSGGEVGAGGGGGGGDRGAYSQMAPGGWVAVCDIPEGRLKEVCTMSDLAGG